MILGVAILAGGAAARMGHDKAALQWLGVRAVDRVAELAKGLGAHLVLTVGPDHYGHPTVSDDQPFGGPVGGVMVGVRALASAGCDRALILAVDAPTIRQGDLHELLQAPSPGAAFQDLHLPMVLDVEAMPSEAQPGWPLARLADRAGLARLACPPAARARLRGANGPEERAALLEELATWEAAQKDSGD
jgi:molybdopterin-guanine dinucleotide biosynthesis protein A